MTVSTAKFNALTHIRHPPKIRVIPRLEAALEGGIQVDGTVFTD